MPGDKAKPLTAHHYQKSKLRLKQELIYIKSRFSLTYQFTKGEKLKPKIISGVKQDLFPIQSPFSSPPFHAFLGEMEQSMKGE